MYDIDGLSVKVTPDDKAGGKSCNQFLAKSKLQGKN